MKRKNGQNIILSDDVTIESGTNIGKSLNEVLERQDAEIKELRSNIKWIYKYGGVGSGKGGGGTSTSWSIYAKLGGEIIGSGKTIVFSEKGRYPLSIQINNPSGGVFIVTYEYTNAGVPIKKKVTLNQDNVWKLEESISLNDNSKISIEVLDENAELKRVESNYITYTHTINYSLIEDSGAVFTSTNRIAFINQIKERGLNMLINYSFISSINSFTIKYTPFGSTETKTESIDLTEAHSGKITLPAFDVPLKEIDERFIGTLSFKLEFIIEEQSTKYEEVLNILPGYLYLLVEPLEGKIYNEIEEDEESIYKYYKGVTSFYLTAYLQSINSGAEPRYEIYVKTLGSEDPALPQKVGRLEERITSKVSLRFTELGWNEVRFKIENTEDDSYYSRTIYIYIKDFESNLNWYPTPLQAPGFDNNKYFYRDGHTDNTTTGFSIVGEGGTLSPVNGVISMSVNSDEELHLVPHKSTSLPAEAHDCLICVGIQYNSTSDEKEKILEIRSGNSETTNITLYQNSVYYGANKVGNIYLGTELEDYNLDEGKNYHLISIYRRLVNENKYELCVYIDGILETAKSVYVTAAPIYTDVFLGKNNFYINALEISYFPHNTNNDYLTDAGIVHYWYTYKEQIRGDRLDPKTLRILSAFEGGDDPTDGVYIDGPRVAVRSKDVLDRIVEASRIPVMMFTYNESAGSFFAWSENHYSDDSSPGEKEVGIQWSPGSTTDDTAPALSEVNFSVSSGHEARFIIEIQGSSTKRFSSKNYTLSLKWSDESNKSTVPIFSPNFDPNDPSTFLPEQQFTLKADIVDSGHSNNTCMGSFINRVTQKFSDSTNTNDDREQYKNFVRNCLEGFPFLLFVGLTTSEGGIDTTKYYYFGIYNFNLGRESFFNLGYSDVSKLPAFNPATGTCPGMTFPDDGIGKGFCFYEINTNYYVRKRDFVTAEIAYNGNYFDFSQYGRTILFKRNDNDDTFMFDDIHYGDGMSEEGVKELISNFVKATARAGGYIFRSIGKEFDETHSYGYTHENTVPGFLKQYKKEINVSTEFIEDTSEDVSNVTENDLLNYVNVSEYPEVGVYTVDYQSLVEYYVICMVFGLIDSVQKNLTIKTWGNRKFYFAFYDMDTCLGIDNNGYNSTYYAFSDFWKSNEKLPTGNAQGVLLLDQVNVLRDYFNKSIYEDVVGFDTPSSYAFAIPKYFHSVTPGRYNNLISPQTLWARWRNSTNYSDGYGYLVNADKFIEEFYLGYMKNVDELMFNYNYRQKYLRHGENEFDGTDILSFHGRRTEYIRDWLAGRFHIMDAYFNLSQANVKLQPRDDFELYEQKPNPEDIDIHNEDIYVIRDIFSSGQSSLNGDLRFTVQAPDFSPLIIKRGQAVSRYLLPDSDHKYQIYLENSGLNVVTLGGSALWTYLDSINSFIIQKMNISSNRLKNINGSSGTATEWVLTLPALQTLSLTSPNYSGKLIFDATQGDNFPNLRSIDISNSCIDLEVKDENVETIKINGVGATSNTAPYAKISGCSRLKNVEISGSRLSSLIVDPVWKKNITLSGNRIRMIDLACDPENPSTLTLSDDAVTTLTVTNFSKVTIKDCPLLEKVILKGNNLTEFKINDDLAAPNLNSLSIEDVSKMTSLSLGGCINLSSLALNGDTSSITYLDLSKTKIKVITYSSNNDLSNMDLTRLESLKTLYINNNTAVTTIKLKNDPEGGIESHISGCSSLTRVYGHMRIVDSGGFSNLPKFRLLGSSWNGESTTISSSNNKTPLQIMAGIDIVNPEDQTGNNIKTPQVLHDEICEKLNSVLSRTKLTDKNSDNTGKAWFVTGSGATNVTFGYTDDGIAKENRQLRKNVLSGICADTPVNEFEIYYIFNAFAISAARCSESTIENPVSDQSLGTAFWYSSNSGRFNYGAGKYLNRYMFYGCSKITSLGQYTFSVGTNTSGVKLLSPSHNDNEVLCDNGLFSPLINLTYVGMFVGTSIYTSRFLFRRKDSSQYYPIKTFWNFLYSGVIGDEIDTIGTKGEADAILSSKTGDLTGFFDNIRYTSIDPGTGEGFTMTTSLSPKYINFNTLSISNTIRTSSIIECFNPSYGYGTIDLGNIFKNKGYLITLSNSFKIGGSNLSYQGILNEATGGTIDSDGKALFPIKNGMFNGFTSLKYIGASDGPSSEYDTGGKTYILKSKSTYGGGDIITGFSGSGLLKYIEGSQFPYDIFKENGLKTSLVSCAGFMSNLTTYGSNSLTTEISFPGTLFSESINLKNVAAFLKNCKIPYRLTSNGFSNCSKLDNITEIFYGDIEGNGSTNNCSKLTGSIPTGLFYHGHTVETDSVEFYGTDSNTVEGLNASDYFNDNHKVIVPKYTFNFTKKVKYAFAAFRGCAQIQPYTSTIDENFGKIDPDEEHVTIDENTKVVNFNIKPEYINPNYTYWNYITVDGINWIKGDTRALDISLVYDGDAGHIDPEIKNKAICEEDFNRIRVIGEETDISSLQGKKSNTIQFFCPPDLFSYFFNDSETNIQYMFSHCGLSYLYSSLGVMMNGRICPYLLKPIPQIESLAGTFRWCSGLSSVKYQVIGQEDPDQSTWLIPETFFSYATGITSLQATFSGTYFEKNPSLNVFRYLPSSLDIRGIFSWCGYYGAPIIQSIFTGNRFSSISGAFSAYPLSITDFSETYRGGVAPVGGNQPLRTGARFGNNFPNTVSSKYTYYVYYKTSPKATDEIISNIGNDTIYHNFS